MKYVVKYTGEFGFIKPFTSMRDDFINSEKYLYPSTINGIEKKIFNDIQDRIVRHRLDFDSLSEQKETTKSISPKTENGKTFYERNLISKIFLINPKLYLFFDNIEDAEIANKTVVFLSRNEDILFPNKNIININDNEIDNVDGFEGVKTTMEDEEGMFVGFNKYTNKRQYIRLEIFGEPTIYKNNVTI